MIESLNFQPSFVLRESDNHNFNEGTPARNSIVSDDVHVEPVGDPIGPPRAAVWTSSVVPLPQITSPKSGVGSFGTHLDMNSETESGLGIDQRTRLPLMNGSA